MAQMWDLGAHTLGNFPDAFTGVRRDFLPIEGEGRGGQRASVSHERLQCQSFVYRF